jgi:Tol biopolymer transport system component
MSRAFKWLLFLATITSACAALAADSVDRLQSKNIFDIEYASGLEMSADGKAVYFVRQFMDIQTDRKLGNIWSVNTKTKQLLPITTGDQLDYNPVLSPDGSQLAFISTRTGSAQIYLKWLAGGHLAKLTHLTASPGSLVWSADGRSIAFQMFVKKPKPAPVSLQGKPEDAKWADAAVYVDDVYYRFDGNGYASKGSTEIFVVSAQGGTPRQLTDDEFNNDGKVSWSKDSQTLYYSANRGKNRDFEPLNTDIYALTIKSGAITQLTSRMGPDINPMVSPSGQFIAYLGFDDKFTNYENTQAYIMDIDGGNPRQVSQGLDRSIDSFAWSGKGNDLVIQYDDKGLTHLALQSVKNGEKRRILSDKLGGQSYGRPYTGAEFTVSENGKLGFT